VLINLCGKWLEYAAESVAIFIVALDLIAFGWFMIKNFLDFVREV